MSQKPIFCAPLGNIVAAAEKRGDTPFMHGDTRLGAPNGGVVNAKIIFAFNARTKTYSIIEVYNPEWACLLGAGINLTFMNSQVNQNDNSTQLDPFKGLNLDENETIRL